MFKVGDSGYVPVVRGEFIETVVFESRTLMLQFRDYELGVFPKAS